MKRYAALQLGTLQTTVVNTLSPIQKSVVLPASQTTTLELEALSSYDTIEASYVITGDGTAQYGKFIIAKDSASGNYYANEDLGAQIDDPTELEGQQITINSACVISNSKVSIQIQNQRITAGSILLSYNIKHF